MFPDKEAKLEEFRKEYLSCSRCHLRAGCTQVVFGEGNPHTKLMFVGEGPGGDEDIQGRPFVGKAGQLLDKILEAAEIPRKKVYISNVVKCRPPYNRKPTPEEMKKCLTILAGEILIIRPKIIVLLGSTALQGTIDPKGSITRMRGKWFEKAGIKFLPTYHPGALLRDERKKRDVWEDFKKIREVYRAIEGSE
ncbi:uracil-DNA glycosylase [Anoxybacter fermentans]|uniref:Type-4 uracil-DNA glycosylase n=1 Tax=Anoxybacter fermentans TaxID=1323375 RepID=A0A3Q9HTA8_9FIRM|nr:uracil-DNA glycosylase [Anoxybacter fermentans]